MISSKINKIFAYKKYGRTSGPKWVWVVSLFVYAIVFAGITVYGLGANIESAQASVTKFINFQGKLTNNNSSATNVANGTYSFEFKMYTASSGGSAVWTETFDQPSGACAKLVVTNGVFNAKLGTCNTSLPDFTGGSMYISVNFNPGTGYDGEMSPRKQIGATVYALVANSVNGDGTVQNTVSSSTALTVAKSGTNYALQVDTSAASAATGLKVTSAAAGSGLGLSVISSGANENLTLDAKGSGTLSLASTSTGNILLAGGYGSSGVSINSSGNIQTNGTLTVDGASTLSGTTTAATINSTGPITVSNAGGYANQFIAYSTGAGSADYSGFTGINNSSDIGQLFLTGSGYSIVPFIGPRAIGFYNNGTGGIAIAADSTSASIRFAAGGTTEQMRLDSNGRLGIGDTSPAALLTVGSGDLFQVNSSGAIAAATGITSSGSITFSGLGGGGTKCVQTDNSGVITAATAACSGARLDQITAATTTASIDSLTNAIAWDWSTATTQNALTLSSSGTGLTSGSVLKVSSATTGAVSNGIAQFVATGAYTSTGGLLNVTANSTQSGNVAVFNGTGLTTGNLLTLNSGTALTTGSALNLSGASYNAGAGNSGKLINVAYTNASSNTSGTSNVIGLSLSPTINAGGSGGIQNNYGIYVQPAAGSLTSFRTTNAYGIRVGNQGRSNGNDAVGLYVDTQSGSSGNAYGVFVDTVGSGSPNLNAGVAINQVGSVSYGMFIGTPNAGYSTSSAFTGKYLSIGSSSVTYTSGVTETGNYLTVNRNNIAGSGTFNLSGNLASLSSNCTVTSGTCGTDTGKILQLTQSYASASGDVLNISGAGTGNLLTADATSTSANGVSIDIQSSSSSQYAFKVTTNNAATNALWVGGDGQVGIGTTAPANVLDIAKSGSSAAIGITSNGVSQNTNATYVGTGADDASAGTITWSSPGSVTANDSVYASATPTSSATTHYLKGTNAGFSIPTNATIVGIVVEINKGAAAGRGITDALKDNTVSLVKGGTASGSNKADTSTTWSSGTQTTSTYGTSSDMWGLSLTPSDVNASNFGAVISAKDSSGSNTATAQVDFIRITIYYTAPSAWLAGSNFSNAGAFQISKNSSFGTNDYFTINNAGNIGIGTVSPAATLDIVSGATTGNAQQITASSLTTGSALSIVGPTSTGVTSGTTGVLNVTSAVGSSGRIAEFDPTYNASSGAASGLVVNGSDTTSNPDQIKNVNSMLSLSGNTSKTGYSYYGAIDDSSSTADTLYGAYLQPLTSGAISSGTRNLYGLYSGPSADAHDLGGTTNVYGGYFNPSGSNNDTGSVENVYGNYITVSASASSGGTINSYGLYIDSGFTFTTGTSAAYGLYVNSPTGADTNYAAIFNGGNVGIGTSTPSSLFSVGSSSQFQVNSSGAIAAATGITSSGTITLSGLTSAGTQCVQASSIGVLSVTGSACGSGGGGGLTVGTSTISSGSSGRVLYDNSGVLGEMTTSGSGTALALINSPAFTTPNIGVASGTSLTLSGLGTSAAVYTNGSSQLTTTAPTSGTIGYWSRSGTALSPATANDVVSVASNVTTGAVSALSTSGVYTGTGVQTITANSLTSGSVLALASSGTSQSTAKYIDIQQTGVTTGFTGNLINLSSSSTTGAASFINLAANSSTLGTGEAISMTGQTTGTGLSITGGGANLAAGGNLINLVMGAATAGNGISVATTGAYTGTGLAVLTANSITSGTVLSLASSGTSQSTDKFISVSQTGVTSGFTGNLINLSSSSTTGAATFINLAANASTTGTGEGISMTALTTGRILTLTNGSALTTGGALNLTGAVYAHGAAETGNLANLSFASASTITGSIATNGINIAATEQTSANTASLTPITSGINVASTVNVTGGASSSGTKTVNAINVAAPTLTACSGGSNACLWNGLQITASATTASITSTALKVVANSLTTDNITSYSATGLTTGKVQSITLGSTLTTGGLLTTTGASYNHGSATETGSLVNLAFTDATNGTATSTTNGILLTPTINVTTGASGAKTINAIKIGAPTLTACTGGSTCTYTGLNVDTTGSLASTSIYSALFNGGNVGIGTSTPSSLFSVGSSSQFQVNSSGAIAAVVGITSSSNYVQSAGTFSLTSANTTQTTTSSAMVLNANSLTSGTGSYLASSSLTSGSLLYLDINGSAGTTGQTGLNVSLQGASASQTTYAAQFTNAHTGTNHVDYGILVSASGSGNAHTNYGVYSTATNSGTIFATNIGGYFSASGSPIDYAAIFDQGNVGIGTTTPDSYKLQVEGNTLFDGPTNIIGDAVDQFVAESGDVSIGDLQNNGNGVQLTVNDSAQLIRLYNLNTGLLADSTQGTTTIGDFMGVGSQTTLDVDDNNQSVNINNGALCVTGAGHCPFAFSSQGSIYSDTASVSVNDLAENYPSKDSSLKPGEVVMIDSNHSEYVLRSSVTAGQKIMGVVSTKPGITLGGTDNKYAPDKLFPIALSGRVPVIVTNENGDIQPGDFLTASSTVPGAAMRATKAGPVIGQAMQGYSGGNSGTISTGSVIAFIKATDYNGADIANEMPGLTFSYADLSQASQTSYDILAHLMQQLSQLDSQHLSQVHADVIIANGEIVTPTVTTHTLHTDELTAATAAGGLSVASTTVFNGGLKVDNIGSIGTVLSIQSDVEFFGTPYFTADTAGFALIKSGAESVDVTFTQQYVAQPIINATISFEQTADPSLINDPNAADSLKNAAITDTQAFLQAGITYAITNKSINGFTIVLNKPAPSDIKFSWISLAVRNATTFTSKDLPSQTAEAPVQTPDGGSASSDASSGDGSSDNSSSDNSTPPTDSGSGSNQ